MHFGKVLERSKGSNTGNADGSIQAQGRQLASKGKYQASVKQSQQGSIQRVVSSQSEKIQIGSMMCRSNAQAAALRLLDTLPPELPTANWPGDNWVRITLYF